MYCSRPVEEDLAVPICLRCRLDRRLHGSSDLPASDGDLRRAVADLLDGLQNFHTCLRLMRAMGSTSRKALGDTHPAVQIRSASEARAVELLRILLPTEEEKTRAAEDIESFRQDLAKGDEP